MYVLILSKYPYFKLFFRNIFLMLFRIQKSATFEVLKNWDTKFDPKYIVAVSIIYYFLVSSILLTFLLSYYS